MGKIKKADKNRNSYLLLTEVGKYEMYLVLLVLFSYKMKNKQFKKKVKKIIKKYLSKKS